MSARFIHVDLEIESGESLELICEEFGKRGLYERHHSRTAGGYLAKFEMTAAEPVEGGEISDPDEYLAELCRMVMQLSPHAMTLWNGAFRRTLDIGLEMMAGERAAQFGLSPETLLRVSGLGASLGITVVPQQDEDIPVMAL